MFFLPQILPYFFFILAVGVQATLENFNLQCNRNPPQQVPVPADCLVAIEGIPTLRLDHHATQVYGSVTLSYPPTAAQLQKSTIFNYRDCAVQVHYYSTSTVMTTAEIVYMYWAAVKLTATNVFKSCASGSRTYGWGTGLLTITRPNLPARRLVFTVAVRRIEQAELEGLGSRVLYLEPGVHGPLSNGGEVPPQANT